MKMIITSSNLKKNQIPNFCYIIENSQESNIIQHEGKTKNEKSNDIDKSWVVFHEWVIPDDLRIEVNG